MKYVIWGCGKIGKTLSILLGKELVSAFIDSDIGLKGKSFLDIPIMDYGEYLHYGMHELIIIAAKGHEKSIGEKLDNDGISWITMEEGEYIALLNQFRLVIKKIIEKDNSSGEYIIYGYNIYGLYLYELLKSYDKKCQFLLQDDLTEKLRGDLHQSKLPICNYDSLKDKIVERIFWTMPNNTKNGLKKKCDKHTDIYEIDKDFDLFYNPELAQFHNIHKGKRCFVVANGPSLKMEDLDKLKYYGEICMAVNGIFKAFKMTKWRPDYYFIVDIFGFLQWKKDILQMDVKEKFVADSAWYFNDDEVDTIHRFHTCNQYSGTELPMFSTDFSKCGYWGYSVVYDGALQMAAYMGFSEIYVLGADCNVDASQGKQHFIKNYNNPKYSKAWGLNIKQLFKSYESARKYCEQHGIRLCNATRGGALEVLERVDFDSLF